MCIHILNNNHLPFIVHTLWNEQVYRDVVKSIIQIIFQRMKETCFACDQTG